MRQHLRFFFFYPRGFSNSFSIKVTTKPDNVSPLVWAVAIARRFKSRLIRSSNRASRFCSGGLFTSISFDVVFIRTNLLFLFHRRGNEENKFLTTCGKLFRHPSFCFELFPDAGTTYRHKWCHPGLDGDVFVFGHQRFVMQFSMAITTKQRVRPAVGNIPAAM